VHPSRYTHPKINASPKKRDRPEKETIIFQASIFRGFTAASCKSGIRMILSGSPVSLAFMEARTLQRNRKVPPSSLNKGLPNRRTALGGANKHGNFGKVQWNDKVYKSRKPSKKT